MRILIEYILPLFLPSVLWVAWLSWAKKRVGPDEDGRLDWQKAPWSWLLAAGLLLAMVIAIGGSLMTGQQTGGYHPARIDAQGHLVPGGFNEHER